MTTMKYLDGKELAGYIQERQAKAVRGLRQQWKIIPKLAVIQTTDNPVISKYVVLKQVYGEDIQAEVAVHRVSQADVANTITALNDDDSVHGIILQLPLDDPAQTDVMCNMISPSKDVDALGEKSQFVPATPNAILWLLAAYNIELSGKNVVLVGRGKLVGAPLEKLLIKEGVDVRVVEKETINPDDCIQEADVIISAAGSPGVLRDTNVKYGAVVVDAGVASEDGKTVGDASDELYERSDLTITPKRGGVGPVTICSLFENLIIAARNSQTKA